MEQFVICIDPSGFKFLTVKKKYKVHSSTRDFVYIANDTGSVKRYGKNRFQPIDNIKKEEVIVKKQKDNKKKVICKIPTAGKLTYNKVYEVLNSTEHDYCIIDDLGNKLDFAIKRFVEADALSLRKPAGL